MTFSIKYGGEKYKKKHISEKELKKKILFVNKNINRPFWHGL